MKEDTKKYNSEITKEDLQALGDKAGNLRNDNGDDELLKNKVTADFSGNDLDVFPGGHTLHAIAPLVSLYILEARSHIIQFDVPGAEAYLPTSHAWHSVLAFSESFPGGHSRHLFDGGVSPIVPRGHSSIGGDRRWLIRQPCATETVEEPPSPATEPGGGSKQDVPFCSPCNHPLGQFKHFLLPTFFA